jgi:hypothetical protein
VQCYSLHLPCAPRACIRVQKVERASLTRRDMPSRGPCGDTMPGTRYISHVYTLCNAWRGKIWRNRGSIHMRSNGEVERAAQASMRVQKVERASLTRRDMPSRGPCGDTMPGTRYISHVYTLCNAWRGKIWRNRGGITCAQMVRSSARRSSYVRTCGKRRREVETQQCVTDV